MKAIRNIISEIWFFIMLFIYIAGFLLLTSIDWVIHRGRIADYEDFV